MMDPLFKSNAPIIRTGVQRVRQFICFDGPMKGAKLRIGEDNMTSTFTTRGGIKGRYRFKPEDSFLHWEESK